MNVSLRITEKQHYELKSHLHPGDGLEAIAFGLCGRLNMNSEKFLLVHELFLLPHDKCERKADYVKWETILVEHLLIKASENDYAIVKFHSHFIQDSDFSYLDDDSDKKFYESVYAWTDSKQPHASFIMYPNGSFKGRVIDNNLIFHKLKAVTVVGENLRKDSFLEDNSTSEYLQAMDRNKQAFGLKTVETLNSLKIGVVGCSGTGSPTIEQLVRLGVGEIILVDPDRGELANMNRIIGLTMEDVKNREYKVDAIKNHIGKIGLNTQVKAFPFLIQDSQELVNELASCDILFGCVDSAEGRHYLNLISHYYLVPLIDIGVKLSSNGKGGIDSINGNIHYLFPGSASLLERKVFSSENLVEDELKRTSKEEYQNRRAYFENEDVVSPAVISVNTLHSSLAVCEMLSRLHHYRYNDNSKYDSTHVNLCDWDISHQNVNLSISKLFTNETLGVGEKQPLIFINDDKNI